MSDTGRKNISEQVGQKVTPDSQKSMMQEAQERASGKMDEVKSSMQPGDSKSTSQKLSDTAGSGGEGTQEHGKGLMESAQEAATSAKDAVSKALGGK
ncbi:hypothetical protein FQN54_008810 [Arachnomyces sp. PD_36]|nr:hypothetical protein FQN54_008810 [Arachnomyces sp. PD_36]